MIALTIALAVLVGVSLGLLGGGGSILTVPAAGLRGRAWRPNRPSPPRCWSSASPARSARSRTRGPAACSGAPALLFGAAGMAGAYAGGLLARFIPGTVLLIGFAVIMIATAIAMLRGRRDVPEHAGRDRCRSCKVVLEGSVVGTGDRPGRRRRRLPDCAGPGAAGRAADARRGRHVAGGHRHEVVRRARRLSRQRAHRLAAWPPRSPPPRSSAA